jgi:hypothetical protein
MGRKLQGDRMIVLVAVGNVVIAIVMHAVLARYMHSSMTAFAVAASVTAGIVALILNQSAMPALDAVSVLLIYVFGLQLYLFLFTLSLASVGSNILAMLANGPLTRDAINARYDERYMVSLRVDRLLDSDMIMDAPRGLELTPSARTILPLLDAAANFFAGRSATTST